MFVFLGRFAHRRRRLVLAGTVVFMIASIATGFAVFDALKSGGFEDPQAESTKAKAILAERFGAGSPDLVLLVSSAGGAIDAPGAVRRGRRLTQRLEGERDVQRVVSFFSEQGAGSGLRSEDGRKALVLVSLEGGEEESELIIERLTETYDGRDGALEVQIGGPNVGLGETIGGDLARAEAIAIPITLVLLLVVFGGIVAALLPLAVGSIAIIGTFLALYLLTLGTDVSIFSINLVTALGLGLAIDYSLLTVSRFREELDNGLDTEAAVARTLETAGRTIAFSSITVIVSLSALLIFPLYFLRSFAYGGIAVVAIATAAALFTLPALLAVLGPRVNRGRRRRAADAGDGFWHALSQAVMRRPVLTGAPVAALLVVLALPFLGVQLSLPDDRVLPPSSEARVVGDSVREDFGGGSARTFPVTLPDATPAQAGALARRISALDGVSSVKSAGADARGSFLDVASTVEPVSPAGERLAADVRALDSDVPFLVSGPSAELADSKQAIFGSMPLALLIIATGTFVLLFLMTGSVLIPIKAIVLNVLSLGATFGAMVWIFQQGHGADLLGFTATGTLDTTMPILMFCIAFGLSMDYEVFLLSRIKEEHDRTHDNTAAVAFGLQKTGRIMTAAAGVLAVTFIAFSTSQVTFIKLFGVGLTLAILMDATLVRGVLVPAFMRLAGEANWWAPRPLRRLHERFGLSEGPTTP